MMRIWTDRVSGFTRGFAVIALSVLLISCASTRPATKNFHVVRSGETLFQIGQRYGYNHKRVARWNRIKAPYNLQIGQLIRISPPTAIITAQGSRRKQAVVVDNRKRTTKKSVSKPKVKSSSSQSKKAKSKPKVISKKVPPTPRNTGTSTKFAWPLKGKVLSGFSGTRRGNQGIDIAGKPGQSVHATAGGKVVYSGQGLRQLGQLIIIKHDSRFLSAYGFNSQLLVKEGDSVRPGQKIAVIGKNKNGHHVLHFEIRRDGIPVNPKVYLR
ncbi:MAG: peptidoglycan DD-metalloendopeptidase family protein [Thiotrichales bacterium]|nr:peptidoglycan DD-metalloendopeptidase family protein [Thiotrichales bacterium]